ncbi:hypothetical protein EXN66_Car001341 [Channa argus]|uniref:Immunoglobulin subtype domain-containing protein n=1 Tax=Channa argus TaxID=215402 RepID=A0A6G1R0D5_CHAAH|nr:hypothetical protein EXN66_Car001341 [Channa argus]
MDQSTFTVTIKDLTDKDTHYWCAVEIKNKLDVRQYFQLSVTTATTPTVSPDTLGTLSTTLQHSDLVTSNEQHTAKPVNSTIVSTGEDILQNEAGLNSSLKVIGLITTLLLLLFVGPTAFYGWKIIRRNQTKHEEPDITAGSQTGSASEVPYATIIHNQHVAAQKKNITDEDTDYWCVVEINCAADDGQYFHLSVNTGKSSLYVDHQEITAFNGDNKTINFHSHNLGEMKWCRLGGSCGSPRSTVTIDVKANMVFTVTMSGLTTESSGWYLCVQGDLEMPVHLTVTEIARTAIFASLPPNPDNTSISGEVMSKRVGLLLLPLGLLIFIVIVTLFIWFRFKTPKQSRDESSVTMQSSKFFPSTQAEGEVTYCDVKYKKENKEQEHKTQHISNNIQHSDSALPPN